MGKTIAATSLGLLLLCSAAAAREGFGFTKKAADMVMTTPPALNVSGTRVDVRVRSEHARLGDDAPVLQKAISDIIEAAESGRLHVTSPADVTIAVDLSRLDVDEHSRSKVEYRSEKRCCDKNGKNYYTSVPYTKYYKVVEAYLEGGFRITDARGSQLDSGDMDQKFEHDYDSGTPSTSETSEKLIKGAARKVAARIVPTQSRVTVLVPKGSFESFIPLAESNSWERYLESVETVRPLGDKESEAYRQYALGVGKEGLAYATGDVKHARELLAAAAEHYRAAIRDNPSEKLFSEEHTSIFSSAGAPLPRVEGSLKSYEAWIPGGTAIATASRTKSTPATRSAGGRHRMHNQSVIDMKKAGLSDDNIILAIDSAEAVDFDTSPEGLIALSKAGVSNNVIKHMQKKR